MTLLESNSHETGLCRTAVVGSDGLTVQTLFYLVVCLKAEVLRNTLDSLAGVNLQIIEVRAAFRLLLDASYLRFF